MAVASRVHVSSGLLDTSLFLSTDHPKHHGYMDTWIPPYVLLPSRADCSIPALDKVDATGYQCAFCILPFNYLLYPVSIGIRIYPRKFMNFGSSQFGSQTKFLSCTTCYVGLLSVSGSVEASPRACCY
jgi:hypothetical protein